MLRKFIGIEYDIVAITLDPQFNGVKGDYSAVDSLCQELGIEYRLIPTNIGEIVFNVRKEPSPCSLCARMRRGALHDEAIKAGCNKIALGHHYNDAVETFIMNLFIEGRIGCFSPVSYLSRKKLYLIRPLVFAPENEIRKAARKNEINIVKSKCPADGHTTREKTKNFISDMEHMSKGFTYRIFGAMRRADIDGWAGKEFKDYHSSVKE
jgi:tRNA(Ile)-lysidine synthase TilS/MesJ